MHVIEENTERHIHCNCCCMYVIIAVRCRNNSCENGGTCLDAYHTTCVCAAGFTGNICETSKYIMYMTNVKNNSQYTGLFISYLVLQI